MNHPHSAHLHVPDFEALAAVHQSHVLVREVEVGRQVLEPRDTGRRDAVSLAVHVRRVVLDHLERRHFVRASDRRRH